MEPWGVVVTWTVLESCQGTEVRVGPPKLGCRPKAAPLGQMS